jgi:tetratricopeptide (TPR) repeat protein
MKNWIQIRHLSLMAASIAVPLTLSAKPFELSENTWSNPEFVNWFTGTYAFDGQVNPQINREEQTLFREISPLMQSSPQRAIAAIRTYIQEAEANQEEDASPYSPALDYTIGSLYLQAGDVPSAISNYKQALKRFPTFQRAYQNLGLTYVQSGDFAEAIPVLTKAIELGATGGTVWGLLGFSYLNTERPTQALTAYEQALLFQPDSRDWRLGKLNALLDAGKRDVAIALLNELLAEDVSDTTLWLQQANAFLGEGETLEAAANLEWVARTGEASGPSLVLLGDIYLNEGLAGLALEAYEAAIGTGNIGADRLLQVVDGLTARGATAEAESFLESLQASLASTLTPDQELKALNLEAQLALLDGRKDEAASILEEVISRDPLNGSALLSLGDYYKESGDIERAVMQYERATKVDTVKIRALLALGRLHVGQRDYRAALVHLREANQIEPRGYVADYIAQLERAVRSM